MGGIAYPSGTFVATGAFAGALLIGALCYGVASGTMSAVTLCAVISGLSLNAIGMACDDYSGNAAILGALGGALIGWLFFGRGRLGAD